MTVNTLYSDLLPKVYLGSGNLSFIEAELKIMNKDISHSKKIVVDTSAKKCSTGLSALRLPLRPYR